MLVIALRSALLALPAFVAPVTGSAELSSVAQTPQAPATVLSAVPASAVGLLYCSDFADFRRRADQNDWVRLWRSDERDAFMDELERDMRSGMELDFERLYTVAGSLRGESVAFGGQDFAGFYTSAPEPRAEVREALRGFLPDADAERARTTLNVGAAQVEIVAWPNLWSGRRSSRAGHFAAFVEHPLALGLVSANDYESLTAALEDAIAGLEGQRSAPLVEGFRAARARASRTTGVEVFADYRSYSDETERMLQDTVRGDLGEPKGMFGLEKDTWLYASIDFHPGRRIDCEGFLNLPKDSLAAKLADTFAPLPATLPARLPARLDALWALQWDVNRFYSTLREAFEAQHGEDAWESIDAGVEAAKGMTGVDPVSEVLSRLDGTFAMFFAQSDVKTQEIDAEWIGLGLLFGVTNGELFQTALERLIESTLDPYLELEDVDGVDVYNVRRGEFSGLVEDEESWQPGGLAFTAGEFLAAIDGVILRRQLRALQGELDASAAGESAGQLFDGELGACFFGAMDLGWLQSIQRGSSLRGPAGADADPETPAEPKGSPLSGVWIVTTARRTPDGFRYEVELR